MGCHGNHTLPYSPHKLFLRTAFSHLGSPIEQFGTSEKLSWLICKVCELAAGDYRFKCYVQFLNCAHYLYKSHIVNMFIDRHFVSQNENVL